jgi:hypothetical protein
MAFLDILKNKNILWWCDDTIGQVRCVRAFNCVCVCVCVRAWINFRLIIICFTFARFEKNSCEPCSDFCMAFSHLFLFFLDPSPFANCHHTSDWIYPCRSFGLIFGLHHSNRNVVLVVCQLSFSPNMFNSFDVPTFWWHSSQIECWVHTQTDHVLCKGKQLPSVKKWFATKFELSAKWPASSPSWGNPSPFSSFSKYRII